MNSTSKKLLSVLLAALMLFSSIPMTVALASEVKHSGTLENDIAWTLDSEGTLTLTGNNSTPYFSEAQYTPWFAFRGDIKKIVINEGIYGVGEYLFYDCYNLTDIDIPSTVSEIAKFAFAECTSLKSVSISGQLSLTIRSYAFDGCTSLETVDIRNEYAIIDDYAFYDCTSLKSVTLGYYTTVGYKSFGYYFDEEKLEFSKLSDLEIHAYKYSECAKYATENGFTLVNLCTHDESSYVKNAAGEPYCYGYVTDEAYYCNECKSVVKGGEIIEATHVDEDEDGFCDNCSEQISGTLASGNFGDDVYYNLDADGTLKLTGSGDPYDNTEYSEIPWSEYNWMINKVEIADGITFIPNYAFYGCSNIETITIPDSVTRIGDYAFDGCGSLREIKFSNNLEEIGTSALGVCISLRELKLPASLRKIGFNAFLGLNVLSLEIPEGVTDIAYGALCGVNSVMLSLPSTLNYAYDGYIFSSDNLKYIKVSSDSKSYSSVDGVLYNYDKTEILRYPASKTGSSYVIPDTVETVYSYAFTNCRNLTDITLSKNISTIKMYSFSGCIGLEKIEFPNVLYAVEPGSFFDCPSLKKVFIPSSVDCIYSEAFGYCNDGNGWDTKKIEGFTLESYVDDSEAHNYANDNGFNFTLLACEHDYDCVESEDATCGLSGYKKYTCTICGNTYLEILDPTGVHQETEYYDKIEPTCTINGFTAGTYCYDCEYWISGREYLLPVAHVDANSDGICDECYCSILDAEFSDLMGDFSLFTSTFDENTNVPDGLLFLYLTMDGRLDEYADDFMAEYRIPYSDYMALADKYFANHSDMKDYLTEYDFLSEDGEEVIIPAGGLGDAVALVYTSSCYEGDDVYSLYGVRIYLDEDLSYVDPDKIVEFTENYCNMFGNTGSYTSSGRVYTFSVYDMKVKKTDSGWQILSYTNGDHYIYRGKLHLLTGDDFTIYNLLDINSDEGVAGCEFSKGLTQVADSEYHWYTEGDSFDLSVSVKDGYAIDSVTLADDNGERRLTANASGLYTITPSGSTSIVIKTKSTHEHNYTSTVTFAPTCGTTGVETYTCSCGDSYTKDIPATNDHKNKVEYPEMKATCNHYGLTAGVYCKDCGKWISGRDYIQPLSHSDENSDGYCDACSISMQDYEFSKIMSRLTFYTYYKFDASEKAPDIIVYRYLYSAGELEKYFNEETYTYELSYSDYMKLVDKHFANHSDMKDYLAERGCFTDESGENLSFYIGGMGGPVTLEYTSSTVDENGVYTLHGVLLDYENQGSEGDKNTIVSKSTYVDPFGKETENVAYYKVSKNSIYEVKVKKTDSGYQILSFTDGDYFDYDGKRYSFSGDELVAHTHSYTESVTKKPTCTSTGVMTYTCSCGDSYTAVIEKSAHKEVTDKAVIPTCTTTGLTEGKHCSVCNEVLVAQKVVPATGHKQVAIKAVAATCTTAGKTAGTKCSTCGKVIKAQTTVKAKGHTYKTTVTAATTKKAGSIVKKCTVCGVQTSTAIAKISSVKLSKTSLTYNGKAQKPTVTVKDSKGNTLKQGTDYTVKYASGCKNVGQYSVTVTFKGNYSGKSTLTYTIVPKGTSISKLTAGSKKLTAKWTKQNTQTTGYEVQYSTSKNMKSAKSVTVNSAKTTSVTLKGLKASKTYYVRVRTYKTVKVNGKNVKLYSAWSSVKNVKVKK